MTQRRNGGVSSQPMGAWPFDTLANWWADEQGSIASELGWSAGPEIYASIPQRMTSKPFDVAEAYEQAIYFLALAARRADFENEKTAQTALLAAKRNIEQQFAQINQSWLCTTTGYGCSVAGAAAVLAQAADSIRASGLNGVDASKICGMLQSNRYGVLWQQWGPWVGAAALGGGVYWYWWRK